MENAEGFFLAVISRDYSLALATITLNTFGALQHPGEMRLMLQGVKSHKLPFPKFSRLAPDQMDTWGGSKGF